MSAPINLAVGDKWTDTLGNVWTIVDVINGPAGQYVMQQAEPAISTLVNIATHGLTSVDVGKPIGWRATAGGKPFVWNDAASTEYPVAVLGHVLDANVFQIATCGAIVVISDTLLPASMPTDGSDTNSRILYWDLSAAKYAHACPSDSVFLLEAVLWLGAGTVAGTSRVVSLLPGRVTANI